MFGFGKSKRYQEEVIGILRGVGVYELLPAFSPINTQIEQFRLQRFSEHEAVLLLAYSSAMSAFLSGNLERAQRTYDLARDKQDYWVKLSFVNPVEAKKFNTHLAENSTMKIRIE